MERGDAGASPRGFSNGASPAGHFPGAVLGAVLLLSQHMHAQIHIQSWTEGLQKPKRRARPTQGWGTRPSRLLQPRAQGSAGLSAVNVIVYL